MKGKDHTENLGKHKMIVLEWILEKQGGRLCSRLIGLRTGASGKHKMIVLEWILEKQGGRL